MYGRRPSLVPSGMEAMRWFRMRPGCRARRYARVARSWNRAVPSMAESAARARGGPASSSPSPALSKRLVDPVTRGDPESPLRWTCKSRAKLAAALSSAGWKVSSTTVGRLLHELGYRLQSVRKSREGASHPDRNAQFEHINSKAEEFLGQSCRHEEEEKERWPG